MDRLVSISNGYPRTGGSLTDNPYEKAQTMTTALLTGNTPTLPARPPLAAILTPGPLFMRVLIALGLTILLIWLVAKVLSRQQGAGAGGRENKRSGRHSPGQDRALPPSLELLDQIHLGHQHRLYLVKAGLRAFLIGTGASGMSRLGEIQLPPGKQNTDSPESPESPHSRDQPQRSIPGAGQTGLPQAPTNDTTQCPELATPSPAHEPAPPRGNTPQNKSHTDTPNKSSGSGGKKTTPAGPSPGTLLLLTGLVLLALLTLTTPALGAQQAAHPPPPLHNGLTLLQLRLLTPLLFLLISLAPLILLCLTSFVKLTVVFSLLRSALGTPTVPPNLVITGISLIFTIIIMAPVFTETVNQTDLDLPGLLRDGKLPDPKAVNKATMPMRTFLRNHSNQDELMFFARMMASHSGAPDLRDHSTRLQVLAPAFMVSELKEAFLIGFLLFIPFIIIDMVVANLLLATGLTNMPSGLLALPFKLLLFVACDGWMLLTRGLLANYAPFR